MTPTEELELLRLREKYGAEKPSLAKRFAIFWAKVLGGAALGIVAIGLVIYFGANVADKSAVERAQSDAAQHALEEARWTELVAKKQVAPGMPADRARKSWGEPITINRTTRASHVDEQWVYSRSYLYFTDGVLRTIQQEKTP